MALEVAKVGAPTCPTAPPKLCLLCPGLASDASGALHPGGHAGAASIPLTCPGGRQGSVACHPGVGVSGLQDTHGGGQFWM